jgi:hypothetical protein
VLGTSRKRCLGPPRWQQSKPGLRNPKASVLHRRDQAASNFCLLPFERADGTPSPQHALETRWCHAMVHPYSCITGNAPASVCLLAVGARPGSPMVPRLPQHVQEALYYGVTHFALRRPPRRPHRARRRRKATPSAPRLSVYMTATSPAPQLPCHARRASVDLASCHETYRQAGARLPMPFEP